jgi:hypothetical protein
MPRSAARPQALRGRVFRGSSVVAQGLLTPKQLRSSAWTRLRQDVYADAELVLTHRLMVSAVGLVLPSGSAFTGRSAAVLRGVPDIASVEDPVNVLLPAGTRWNARSGVRARSMRPNQPVVRVGRWRCADRVDTALDVIRRGAIDEAVIALDRLVRDGMVGLDDVRQAAAVLPRGRGSAQARTVAQLADGQAESPQETRLRLVLAAAGLPCPVAQYRVFDGDGFIARVDFAYPELRIAIEYDGLWHGERRAFLDDRRRLNRLVAAGWIVLHVTVDDLHHPERLAARVRVLRAQRLALINTR